MTVLSIPPNQQVFINPYFQNLFTFSGSTEDVRLCRYINNILRIFGNNVVMHGGGVSSVNYASSTFTMNVTGGALIQDMTLVPFDDFTINMSYTPTGDTASSVATKTTAIINAIGGFSASAINNIVTVQTSSNGVCNHAADGNTGFTVSTTQSGTVSQPEIFTITCTAPVKPNSYFKLSTPTTDYYVWYKINNVGTDPAVSSRTSVTCSTVLRSPYIVLFTDYQYLSSNRSVTLDPCPFYFRLYSVNYSTGIMSGYTWTPAKNLIVMAVYDYDAGQFVQQVTISGTSYPCMGINLNNYNYFWS